jgi:branched-chain amino acid transport system substrate-binding protein
MSMSIWQQRPTDPQGHSRVPVRWARGPEQSRALLARSSLEGRNLEDASAEDEDFNRNEVGSLPDLRSRSRIGKVLRVLGAVTGIGLVSATVALLLVANFLPKRVLDFNSTSTETNSAMTQPFGAIATPRQFTSIQKPPAVATNSSQTGEARTPPAATNVAVAPAITAKSEPASVPVRGITDKEIRFGMSAPFTGSAKELGREMKLGIETAFNLANESGGVHGRQLRLVSADDGYEPARTGDTMKQLFEREQVFGIIGNVGTPTAMVALPYALEHKMLFFGAFTGAGLLRRDPPDRYVFNYRASYAEETDAVVRYLIRVRKVRPEHIAVFEQQDSYGDAGFEGVARAIRVLRSGDEGTILRLNYKRNTIDVDDAIAHLRAHRPPIRAVVMVATYRAAAKFIEKTRDLYPNMIYTNVSFVGSTAFADELMLLGPHYAEGVIVTQVVPAIDSYATKVLEYKSVLAKYFPGETPDYVSLEGYITAGLLIEALKRTGAQIDTEKLVNELEGLHAFDMGLGTLLNFGLTEHQGSHKVWGTQLDANGHYQSVDLQ